jgi:hypothetical protein
MEIEKLSEPIGQTKKSDSLAFATCTTCVWKGSEYSPGAKLCDSGNLYECMPNGTWHIYATYPDGKCHK